MRNSLAMEVKAGSGIFHKTTIEKSRETYKTVPHAGQKRTFDEAHTRPIDTSNPILADITNSNDYIRPLSKQNSYASLTASKVHDVVDRSYSEYSQRRGLALTPTATLDPLLDLSHPSYNLLPSLVKNFLSSGVKSIYPWQSEWLLRSGALDGQRNLVYTAPTGGGKSLVAEVLMLKKVIENPGQKALLVLPYVALVQEKVRCLRNLVEGIRRDDVSNPNELRPSVWRKRGDEKSIKVMGSFGGSKFSVNWQDFDIAVCTIEKVSL